VLSVVKYLLQWICFDFMTMSGEWRGFVDFLPEIVRLRSVSALLKWACESKPDAEVEVPDGKGGFTIETMPLWMAASFTIGESGVWFFSLLWENGIDQPPVEFVDARNVVAPL